MPVGKKLICTGSGLNPNICNFKSTTLCRIRHVVGGSTSLLSCQQAQKLNVGTVIVDMLEYEIKRNLNIVYQILFS